jgi:hypothetical protein
VFDVRSFPSPPVVAAAFSGFVVGVLVTLIATGTVGGGSASPSTPSTLPLATPVADAQMYDRVRKLVVRQLGLSYPTGKVPRLQRLTLVPAGPYRHGLGVPDSQATFRSVYIEFRLNDHPLGRTWRLRTAKADIFAVFKALYTSLLPIYNVEMDGSFTVRDRGAQVSRNVLVARINHHTADGIPWKRWGRDNEARLWTMLSIHYVDPRFA